MKRILCVLLSVLMVMAMLCTGVSATSVDDADPSVTKEELMNVYVGHYMFPVAEGFNTVVFVDYWSGLSNVHIYAWSDADGYNTDGKYPGEPMKFVGSTEPGLNSYVAYIPEEFDRFIILDYDSETQSVDDNCQSQDFVLEKSLGICVQHGDTGEYVFGSCSADFYSYPGNPCTEDEDIVDESSGDEATKDEPAPIFPDEPQPEGTYRYYFYLPDQWVNDYAYTAGIYWWEGSISGDYWPGNEAKSAGVDGVYYYDVATDTPTIIWNNYLDGGMDSSADIYTSALQTVDIPVSGGNFDGMIYIISLDQIHINSYNNKATYGGEWYYYYGNGEYGTAPTKAEADTVYTDKSFGEWATPDETPTEPTEPTTPVRPTVPATEPTEVPAATDPSESPSEPVVTEPTEVPGTALPTEPASDPTVTTETLPQESSSTAPAEEEYQIGDVNMDGKLNIRDATYIQKYLAKFFDLDLNEKALADFDLNGKVNVKDVTSIQKKIAGLI